MFAPGVEEDRYGTISAAVKRPLYGADCYAYALVASGFGADLVVEADLGLYDYCAVVPVLQGAGGVVSDWNGAPLTLANHEASASGTMRVVAAANARIHAEAVQILSGGGAPAAPAPVPAEGAAAAAAAGDGSVAKSAWSTLLTGQTIGVLLLGVGIGVALSSGAYPRKRN